MAFERPHRHRIRLAPSAYAEVGTIFSVTICVKDRVPVFTSDAVARAAVQVLEQLARQLAVPVYAWCVMPDHVHLVVGPSSQCDVVTFVGRFKNLSLRAAWRLGVVGAFWQTSFWDHAIRRDEQLRDAIAYVFANPVRAGLVADSAEYAHCGGYLGPVGNEIVGTAGDKPPPYGLTNSR